MNSLYSLSPEMKLITMKILFSCLFFLKISAITQGHVNFVAVAALEGSDTVLPCSLTTKQNLVQMLFDWRKKAPNKQEVFMYDEGCHYNNGLQGQDKLFRGRVSHFPEELESGNASIIIRNVRMADSGEYTCEFPRLQPEQTFIIKLVVECVLKDRSEEKSGAAPKPYTWILNTTEDRALLKCEVPGASPKPKVEWQDSDGNILPAEEPQVSYRGDRCYITLLTNVTKMKTNLLHCVATQEELCHVTHGEIYVHYHEKTGEFKSCSGLGVFIWGWVCGVLTVAAPLALFVAAKHIRKRGLLRENRDDPSKDP